MSVNVQALPKSVAVIRDANACARFAGEHGGAAPLAIARPTTPEQLAAVMGWAGGQGMAVTAYSSPQGPRNGTTAEPSLPGLALDLSHMSRLVHADGDDRVAVIEPGMTFGAFDGVLRPHGLRAFKPLLPRRGKSVIAAYLDRDPITSPNDHWDTTDPFGGAEIVFANGERFHTGGASVSGDLETQLARGARQMLSIGPGCTDFLRVLHGSQGTLGIVSWAAVYCEALPALEKAYLVGSDTLEPLVDLAYRVAWRRLDGQTFIVNRTQLAMALGLGGDELAKLGADVPEWALYANLTVPGYFPDEKLAWIEADFVADAKAAGLVPGAALGPLRADAVAQRQGALPEGCYKDDLLGAHREVFFLTQLDAAARFVRVVDDVASPEERARIGFYLQPRVQGVNCHFEIDIPFDPADPVATTGAATLQDRLAELCGAAGGYFSRPREAWSRLAFARNGAFQQQLRATKDLLDPAGILKPDTWASFLA